MTREETVKIIRIICDCYPNFKPNNLSETVDVWQMMLEEYSYNQVSVALKAYVTSNTSGFAPGIGEIVAKIQTISQPQQLSELEAWYLVSKAKRNGIYGAEEEFNKLPPLVQKAVGRPGNLVEWAQLDSKDNAVLQSNFMRTYRAIVDRATELSRMPQNIRKMIEENNVNSYKAQITNNMREPSKSPNNKRLKNEPLQDAVEASYEIPEDIKERIENLKRR